MFLRRPQVVLFVCLAAIALKAVAVPLTSDEELYPAETRLAQGWFKGFGYGSFGFSEEDGFEEDSKKDNSDKRGMSQQRFSSDTGKTNQQGKKQETQNNNNEKQTPKEDGKNKQEMPMFRDYYFVKRVEQNNQEQRKQTKGTNYEIFEIEEPSEEQQKKKQYSEDIDEERKELEQKVREYFAHVVESEGKTVKEGGSGKFEEGGSGKFEEEESFKGRGKIAVSAVHQTSFFPTYFLPQQQPKNSDNKNTQKSFYQQFYQ